MKAHPKVPGLSLIIKYVLPSLLAVVVPFKVYAM